MSRFEMRVRTTKEELEQKRKAANAATRMLALRKRRQTYARGRRQRLRAERPIMIKQLQEFVDRNNRPPAAAECNIKHALPSLYKILVVFGGLRAAIGKLRIPSREKQELAKVRAFIKAHRRLPTFRECNGENGLPSAHVLRYLFGTFSNAKSRFNNRYNVRPRRKSRRAADENKKREQILCRLRAFRDRTGRDPVRRELNPENGLPTRGTIRRWFGSPTDAFKALRDQSVTPSENSGEIPKSS